MKQISGSVVELMSNFASDALILCMKDMLKSFVSVFLEKVISVYTSSRVICIRFDRDRPPNEIDSGESNKKLRFFVPSLTRHGMNEDL